MSPAPWVKQYAFYFDSNACSGCKACQAACKDKHDLPVDVLWRRVYEVTGGNWVKSGDVWVPGVFSYYLSMACHHCEKPICGEGCPTKAIYKRQDGIVILDTQSCIGCRYCEWACPYGAMQFVESERLMTKCHFCYDYIDLDKPPACVAACPMRALDFGELTDLREEIRRDARGLPASGSLDHGTGPPHQAAQGRGACHKGHRRGRKLGRDLRWPGSP